MRGRYECLLAVGVQCATSQKDVAGSLDALKLLHDRCGDWLFGHICYDYKNEIEPGLSSLRPAKTGFPPLHFFIPEAVCYINKEQTLLTVECFGNPEMVLKQILVAEKRNLIPSLPVITFNQLVSKEEYMRIIRELRSHIYEGDCYEINLCNSGYCEQVAIDPASAYAALVQLSPAPFAAYYRLFNRYMMCASPERYLYKDGSQLLSQPIKGTARRGEDAESDMQLKERLYIDPKERAENVMITDLVRNDLARCCETGSVCVEELFGIYTFPQVHQMISSVTGTMRKGTHFTDAIRCTFPMGSMTGAPKYKVMQLIERYEQSRRELFSGTVGYITPEGDFDFNVVIRSLFYDADSEYLSYQTGGAITYDSDPEQEWLEMRLKAWALEKIFVS